MLRQIKEKRIENLHCMPQSFLIPYNFKAPVLKEDSCRFMLKCLTDYFVRFTSQCLFLSLSAGYIYAKLYCDIVTQLILVKISP